MNHLSLYTIFALFIVSNALFGRSNGWTIQFPQRMENKSSNDTVIIPNHIFDGFMESDGLSPQIPYHDINHILLLIFQ
jgi:hypothetical protein